MEKLTSMTEFVLDINNLVEKEYDQFMSEHNGQKLRLIEKYANFLSQPLNISMFIPAKLVDGEWVVLQKPVFKGDSSSHWLDNQEYLLVLSNVLFEGFELNQKNISKLENIICITKKNIQLTFFNKEKSVFLDELDTNKTKEILSIEHIVKYNLTLTTTAKKQIGL